MSPKKALVFVVVSGLVVLLGACDMDSGESGLVNRATGSVTTETVADPGGQVYGAGVEDIESISIAAIAADPEAFNGKMVRVEGMVTDVCAKRGCWIELAGGASGAKARFKVTDGEMVFPMSAKGQSAVAQGRVITQTLSLEELRALEEHFAKEAGLEFDPDSVTEGRTVFRIQGTGAVIGDAGAGS